MACGCAETFVFTDIVDSTGMIAVIGDDAWVMLRRWHDSTLRSMFATHGGNEIDHAGDGFFVAFADASAAAACAVDIQRTLESHSAHRLELRSLRRVGPDVVLRYAVRG